MWNAVKLCTAKQMDFDKAAECNEKSLIIKRLAVGNNSLSTAKTLHNIGVVNEGLGLLDDSLNYYKDAVAVRTMLLVNRHTDVASLVAGELRKSWILISSSL